MTTSPLRVPLLLNASFSLGTGLLSLLVPDAMHLFLGAGPPVAYRVLGAMLVGYSAGLFALGFRPNALLAALASLADLAWVAGSAAILIGWSGAFTVRGELALVGIAAIVGLFAWLQLRAIRAGFRFAGARAEYQVRVSVPTSASPTAMWNVIRDIGNIQRYLPSLRSSEIVGGWAPGIGAVRQCIDHKGAKWFELCDTWDEGSAFSVVFNTAADDFPFPFSSMRGGWQVDGTSFGCSVTVWWRVVPRRPLIAGLLFPLMERRVKSDFGKVINRMAVAALR